MADPTFAHVTSWKRELFIQCEQTKNALRSEDATFFRVCATLDRHRDTDVKAELTSLLGIDADPTKNALEKLNVSNTGELSSPNPNDVRMCSASSAPYAHVSHLH
jgi:hypothetical protein